MGLAYARGLPTVLVLSFLVGLFGNMYRPAANALVADVVAEGDRVVAMGVQRFFINAGFAAGPAVAGLLAARAFIFGFIFYPATPVSFGVLALSYLPRAPAASDPADHRRRDSSGGAGLCPHAACDHHPVPGDNRPHLVPRRDGGNSDGGRPRHQCRAAPPPWALLRCLEPYPVLGSDGWVSGRYVGVRPQHHPALARMRRDMRRRGSFDAGLSQSRSPALGRNRARRLISLREERQTPSLFAGTTPFQRWDFSTCPASPCGRSCSLHPPPRPF